MQSLVNRDADFENLEINDFTTLIKNSGIRQAVIKAMAPDKFADNHDLDQTLQHVEKD